MRNTGLAAVACVVAATAALVWLFLRGGADAAHGRDARGVPAVAAPIEPAPRAGTSRAEPVRAAGRVRAETPPADPATPGAAPGASPPARGSGVSGVVTRRETGEPVAGATIRWYPLERIRGEDDAATIAFPVAEAAAAGVTRSDAGGGFSFPLPDGAVCRVVATADGSTRAIADAMAPARVALALHPASRVEVQFVDEETRAAIPGVVAHVFARTCDGASLGTVEADAGGRAAFGVGAVPTYAVLATAPGFVGQWESLRASEKVVEFALCRAASLSGTVVDAAGAAIAGATVACDMATRGDDTRATVVTGPDGRFRFDVVPGENRTLGASAEGFAPAEIETRPSESDVFVALERAAWIDGTVVDEAERPVDEFTVRDGRRTGPGRFERGPLPPGVHRAQVTAHDGNGERYGQASVALGAGERRTLRVVLDAPTSDSMVRHRFVNARGDAVGGHLRAETPEGDRVGVRTEKDAAGVKTAHLGVPAGTPVVLYDDPEPRERGGVRVRGPRVAVVTVSDGADAEVVDVPTRTGHRARVRCVDADGAVLFEDARERLVSASGDGWIAHEGYVVAADGVTFPVQLVLSGQALWRSTHDASEFVDGVLTVRVRARATVRGRVTVSHNPGALQGPIVQIDVADDARTRHGVRCDEDGAFVLRGIPDGEATVTVRHANGKLARRTFRVAGNDVDLGDIELGRLTRLRGVVVDERDRPLTDAAVGFESPPHVFVSGETDESGAFALVVPEEARGVIWARRDDAIARRIETIASHDAPPLRLVVADRVDVLVRCSFGDLSGVGVYARPSEGGPEFELGRSTWGGEEFRVHVPPGAWTLRVTYDGRVWRREIVARRGAAVEIVLEE